MGSMFAAAAPVEPFPFMDLLPELQREVLLRFTRVQDVIRLARVSHAFRRDVVQRFFPALVRGSGVAIENLWGERWGLWLYQTLFDGEVPGGLRVLELVGTDPRIGSLFSNDAQWYNFTLRGVPGWVEVANLGHPDDTEVWKYHPSSHSGLCVVEYCLRDFLKHVGLRKLRAATGEHFSGRVCAVTH